METIFVLITSDRDTDTYQTINDLFDKAAQPSRVFVGTCWHSKETGVSETYDHQRLRPHQVRRLHYTLEEGKGVGWAKLQAQALWQGEDYVLQIQSGSLFEQNWDTTLIATLAACPSQLPVLSAKLQDSERPACVSFVSVQNLVPMEPRLLTLQSGIDSCNPQPDRPRPTPFWTGELLFARGNSMLAVPFDPHIFCFGETIAYSARLWTSGYDIFQPDRPIIYRTPGEDRPETTPDSAEDSARHASTLSRIRHLLRLEAAAKSSAVVELDHYGLGRTRTLDDYWRFAGIDFKTGAVADFARAGRWDPPVGQSTLATSADPDVAKASIFVQIASYRDPECQWTVRDLLDKASFPERITIGICWQFDPAEDKECFQISFPAHQVRVASFHWKDSKGVCWARRQTQLLWRGEQYTLVIDSHMRFEYGWDDILIATIDRCASPKAVLSNLPSAYTPPHTLDRGSPPTIMRAHPYSPEGDLRFRGDFLDRAPDKPLKGAFIAAGFMFSKSSIIEDVPYDPFMYFDQEEVSLSARFYTKGWDVFHLNSNVMYHLYNIPTVARKRSLHWDDDGSWSAIQQRSRQRLGVLLERRASDDPDVTRDLALYGLGSVRSLESYEAFCGIDFKLREVSQRALRCRFIENLDRFKATPIYIPEIDPEQNSDVGAVGLFGPVSTQWQYKPRWQ